MPMATEPLNLRTALTGGFALAAGLLWVAALLGLGSGIGAPPPADTAPPPLPALPALAPSPIEAPSSFAAVSAQPVFAEDRLPHPFRINPQAADEGGSLRLAGVLITDAFGMATLVNAQNRSIRLRLNGDAVDGWQLLALEPRRATVLGPNGAQVLELGVFDGQGGEPPTLLGATAQPQGQGGVPRPSPPVAAGAAESTRAAAGSVRRDDAAPGPAPPSSGTASNGGPSEDQMNAIRERIRARRAQLQQQQQQQSPPPGGAANR